MRSWRHLLLVVSLLLGQLLAGAHAVEHAASEEDGLPTHVCQLCLAAHDLGAALPSVVSLPPVVLPLWLPESPVARGRTAFPPALACQRGPPAA